MLEDALRHTLAARARARRAALGLSQEQVAERAGLAARQIQRVEAGTVNVTLGTLAGLATALDTQVYLLITPE